jgi:autotransporter passenger strand-loop-strand repeat protein
VSNGGEQEVWGFASGTTVTNGGVLLIGSGGVETGAKVSAGGTVIIDGGVLSGGTISGTEIYELVSARTVSNETITSGLDQTVVSGGRTISTTVDADAEQDLTGGKTTATTILSGGAQYVYSGIAVSSVISTGGYQDVYTSANFTSVLNGGVEIVESGAVSISATLSSGGVIVAYYGADLSGTQMDGGTISQLSSGQTYPEAAALIDGGRKFSVHDSTPIERPAAHASVSPMFDTTVSNLIQAMAIFDGGRVQQGAFFDDVSARGLHLESAVLALEHHKGPIV